MFREPAFLNLAHPAAMASRRLLIVAAGAALLAGGAGVPSRGDAGPPRRVYPHLLDPREHPDDDRRPVRPPTWATFKHRTQFTTLRRFGINDGRLVDVAADLETYTRTHALGDVVWPSWETLFATNLDTLADEIRARDLYLFDIWGYVPGSGTSGPWQQFRPPAASLAMLETRLGDRWLGTDIGEQDGRYIGGYAAQMTPASAGRVAQYLAFQRHVERMGDDLGHRHVGLVSLTYGHALLREGTFTLLGAETAQAHPNNQVLYAFIRGAGKQHGVPWFGNVSLFNRWGYKVYGPDDGGGGDPHGPAHGTSLSLMKRLLYAHILGNCVVAGFEGGWFDGAELSPIGRLQQAAQRWVVEHGQPGVMHTPVAVVVDTFSGWTVPRHLSWAGTYRVWGNLPYGPGDHLTDGVFTLLYPGYQNASYFHDESGFIAPTPCGEIADCLTSDAPPWLLDRYAVVIVAGEVHGGRELRDRLQAHAERGGHVVITAGNLAALPGGLAGRTAAADTTVACGRGCVTFFTSPFGVVPNPDHGRPGHSEVDAPLVSPCSLEPHVRQRLMEILRGQRLFSTSGEGLSLITCRRGAGDYTVGVMNTTWREQPLRIDSHCGPVEALRELPLDQSERDGEGWTPIGIAADQLGTSRDGTIAGGDVRIFRIRVAEAGVEEVPHVVPQPRPRGRILTLRGSASIKEHVLTRPTFFQHFDGVCIDWRLLHDRDPAAVRREAPWVRRQGLRVVVDLSSGLDLFPTLRLIDNDAADHQASAAAISDVLTKMEILAARDLVLTLHRDPENNVTGAESNARFTAALKRLAAEARTRGVTLHLRLGPGKPPRNFAEAHHWLDLANEPNLTLAVETAMLDDLRPETDKPGWLTDRLGLWLVAGGRRDVAGARWDTHAPLHRSDARESTAAWLATAPDVPLVLDAVFADQDEEYRDAVAVESVGLPSPHPETHRP